MSDPVHDQGTFAAALLDPQQPCPPGLHTWNNSDPAQRFRVYRNNVIVSLIDALGDTFPVTQELVGDEFFRAMARVFAYSNPPTSPVLARYGEFFPAFIENFPPAASLPYLADVARLEMLRVEAYHAADAPSVSKELITKTLTDKAALLDMSLVLHPSLRVLQSNYAVVSLWAAHQGVLDISSITPEQPESALITRVGLDVEIVEISTLAARFINKLKSGTPLGSAVERLRVSDPEFNLPDILGLLIQKGALVALNTTRRNV